jgi:hypothetical protein
VKGAHGERSNFAPFPLRLKDRVWRADGGDGSGRNRLNP